MAHLDLDVGFRAADLAEFLLGEITGRAGALAVSKGANVIWSMDFMADRREDGGAFWRLNVLNDFNQGLGVEVDFSLPAEGGIRNVGNIIKWRRKL